MELATDIADLPEVSTRKKFRRHTSDVSGKILDDLESEDNDSDYSDVSVKIDEKGVVMEYFEKYGNKMMAKGKIYFILFMILCVAFNPKADAFLHGIPLPAFLPVENNLVWSVVKALIVVLLFFISQEAIL